MVRAARWVAGGVAAVLLAVIAFYIFYTPTRDVSIANHLGSTVTVSGCGDPETVPAGESANIQVNTDSVETECLVYGGDKLLGCLIVPKARSNFALRAPIKCRKA